MRYLVIGDIHGCFDQLCKYQSWFSKVDKVIFVGDYMDRGSNSIACMNLVANVENAVTLIGNHEWKYYLAFNKGDLDFIPKDVDPKKKMKFWDALLKIMYRHDGARQRYYRDENIIVSHAPSVLWQQIPDGKKFKDLLIYGKKKDERDADGYRIVTLPEELYNGEISYKPVVYGHIHRPQFKIRENEYCVDFDAGKGGPIAALLFEDDVVVSALLDGKEVSLDEHLFP